MSLLKSRRLTATQLRLVLNLWPPMRLGPGIRVDEISSDFTYARTSLPMRFYNRNYVGSHFGGSLYSMTDPMYMLMLLQILGPEYIVWDKAATIEYRKPGKGTVTADFHIPHELIDSLRTELQPNQKRIIELQVDVKDEVGDIVAHVVKTEYIRRKPLKSNL
jgi:hypothetical protein